MKWEELPLADRAQLMAAAVRNGYTDIRSIKAAYANFQNQRQQTGNRYDDGGEFEVVNPLDNVPVDDQEKRYQYFRSTLPENLQDDTVYRLRRAWELNGEPRAFSDAIAGDNPMFSYNIDDELYHGNSVAYNPNTDEYEFLKPVDHDTVDLELMQYFNNPELEQLRQNYQMDWDEDGSRGYYKYVPRTDDNALGYGGNLFKTGGNKQSKKDYYRQQLIIRGLRGAQLEAVLANMEMESGFNPKAYNKSSGAQGLMQWLGSRKPKSWSEKDQLDYIAATYNKFGGDEWLDKKAWKRFNETTDPAEAARLFRRYWERPERGSWNATDKLFKNSKGSYLPQEVNDLVAQVSNLQYDEPKAPIFTEEDQRLLDTPVLAIVNPEYEDTQAPDYKPSALQEAIKLDESLWRDPANNWALYNQFANMQQGSSQDDPLGWMTTMASLSPNTTPEQKEAASTMYQLFAPQDGDYSYHGLNFAAYGGKVNRFDGYGDSHLNAVRSSNPRRDGYYITDGAGTRREITYEQALELAKNNPNLIVNYYKDNVGGTGRLHWDENQNQFVDNNEYFGKELDNVDVVKFVNRPTRQLTDAIPTISTPILEYRSDITPYVDFTNTDQNMFHRKGVANADAAVREALSSDVVDHVYDYMMPSTWAGLADKALEGGYNFNQLFNPTYDNQGWVGLFGADQWAKEHPEEAFAINFGADLLFPYGVKGAKTAVSAAASRIPEASRNLIASTAINYGAKTRNLPTNIYKQRMLFNVGENGRYRYIHEYDPLADFIDTKRRVPSNTSYFFRSPNNIDILNVNNGRYGAKAEGNLIVSSGSVDGKFVSYGEPWMEFGVNPKLDAWYEFPTMRHRGPHRMATDWRGNVMDYTTQEAYDQMAIRRNPEFIKENREFMFKNFNSREEALQAQKEFNEKWGIDPSVNVYDIYHSNQTVIPNKEWNFNSEYPRGFLSQPFWRYTADPYSGAVQKELMMNWPSSSVKLVSNKDILPISSNSLVDRLSEQWDWNRDLALFRGDTQELQRLRDLHFKSAAPNNKYIKSSGMPEEGTHGTNNNFYSFELEGPGIKHGDPGDYGYGHYFYPGNTTSTYGDRQIHAYLNMERPYTGEWNRGFNRGQAGLSQTLKNMRSAREFGLTNLTPEEMIEELNKLKISDGVLAMSPYSDRIQEIVIPTGNQIKLVNPLTFDNNGNLIPLSSRDNFNINDMRFSTGGIIHLK